MNRDGLWSGVDTHVGLINPWHACAARVTVLVLYVCLSVTTFLHLHASGEQNSDTRRFVTAMASF